MATLYIGEYADIGSTPRGSIPIPLEPPRSEQSLELSATSIQSDSFSSDTSVLLLVSDVDCAIAIGADPDATTSARFLAAGQEKIVTVTLGSKLKVAAVARGSGSMSDSLGSFLSVVADPVAAKKSLDALAKQAAVADASAQTMRVAADTNRKAKTDADAATQKAEAAKAANDRSVADVVAAAAAADAKEAQRAAQAVADQSDADKRKATLDAQAVALSEQADRLAVAFNKVDIAEADLSRRERVLADGLAKLTTAQDDYAAKLAKLKALTG